MSKLWSHEAAQALVTADSEEGRDAREVLSRRYSSALVLILPTESGRFAILGVDRQLIDLLDDPPTASYLRDLSLRLGAEMTERSRRINGSAPNDPPSAALGRTRPPPANNSSPITVVDDL